MKTAGNAILLRMRQEETYRDFVRQLLSVGCYICTAGAYG